MITITWTDPNGPLTQEDEVRIYRDTAFFDAGSLPAVLTTLAADSEEYEDTTADPDTSYWYGVALVKDGREVVAMTSYVIIEAVLFSAADGFGSGMLALTGATVQGTLFSAADGFDSGAVVGGATTVIGDLFSAADGFGSGVVSVEASDPHFSAVKLLLSFDGSDGATSTTDYSSAGRTITFNGTAQLDTAEAKFGASSLYLADNTAYISAPNHADLLFGSGNFTVEMFYKPNVDTNDYKLLCGVWNTAASQKSWAIFHNTSSTGNTLAVFLSTNGSTSLQDIIYVTSFALDGSAPFYHIALDFDGTKYRLYVNGVMVGSRTGARTLYASTALFTVGDQASGNVDPNRGWIDELRITKGVARYASDSGFTPPTSRFPRS